MPHFRDEKMDAQATQVACSKSQGLAYLLRFSSVLEACVLSIPTNRNSLFDFGKVTRCLCMSPRCHLCHSLSFSVSRKLGPLPLSLAFNWCQSKAGVFILHVLSGQVMVLSVALLLRNGHGYGSSHVAFLHGCNPYWVPVTQIFPSTLSLQLVKAPTPTSPGMAVPAISSSCPLLCMQSHYPSLLH